MHRRYQSTTEVIDTGRARQVRARIQPRVSDISIALSDIVTQRQLKESPELPRDTQLLLSFRGHSHEGIKTAVVNHLSKDSQCSDAIILKRGPGEVVRVISTNASVDNTTHSTRVLPGITEVLSKRAPVLLDKFFVPWKILFYYKPKVLLLLPVNIYRHRPKHELLFECIVVLAYKDEQLPEELLDELNLKDLIAFCNLTAPLLFNVQRFDDSYNAFKRYSGALDCTREVEKEMQDVGSCINTIGLEIQSLFEVANCVVFIIVDDLHEPKLVKYASFGGAKVDSECPDRHCHTIEEFHQGPSFPVGWSALHKKILRANDAATLARICGPREVIHAIGGCCVKNIMCFVIDDRSGDMSLAIEVCGRSGGFTEKDENAALLFATRVSSVLSSSVLLDYRKRAVRRNYITNELINNIKTAKSTKVKHLLDLKFSFSKSFLKRFLNFKYIVRRIDTLQLPGIILYMFTELNFIARWKIRRATLIRFILSLEQAYRANPYHNWKHACTVAHFAYVLIKKLRLQKDHFLTDIEALALFVACLSHDVDHRGANSRFISLYSTTDSNEYSLYTMEGGLVQRQHVAVTLQILSTEESNFAENMSDEEYREFAELIQWNIIATDVGHYMRNKDHLFAAMSHFDKTKASDRKSFMAVCMSVCDFCETIKPWNDYILTVLGIISEFFTQGDEELRLGMIPIQTMDRRFAYIPQIEMKFLNDIVRPVYHSLAEVLPKLDECITALDNCKELWLVSTQVFEDNATVDDPLTILTLPDMREEQLKYLAHPELERHAHRIRKSIGGSLPSIPFLSRGSISLPMENFSFHPPEPSPNDLPKVGCCKMFMMWAKCRRRVGLDNASIIRKFNREDEFVGERMAVYERRRSSFDGSGDITDYVRNRLNSLALEGYGDSAYEIGESMGSMLSK